jgi:hypothetical protein
MGLDRGDDAGQIPGGARQGGNRQLHGANATRGVGK